MTGLGSPTTRPRNRRQQILAAAAQRFHTSGYHNVSMTDIADAIGITAAALYRHFRGKQDLLLATVRDAIDQVSEVVGQAFGGIDEMLGALATSSMQSRDAGILWEREMAHLPADLRHELRARLLHAVAPLRAAIGHARPTLPPDDLDVLLWAVLAVFVSTGYHTVTPPSERFRERLLEAAHAVCQTTALPQHLSGAFRPAGKPAGLLPVSRREAVLTAAMRLYSEHGYQAVGVDEIGAAAGITGPSVYHHFSGKNAILTTALARCLEAMFFDLSGALYAAESYGDALDRVLRSYVRTSTEHGEPIGGLFNEIVSLPIAEQDAILKVQRDYLAEWVALLIGHRPALTVDEARVLVHAAVTVINSLMRIRHLRRRPALERELVELGRAVLGLGAQAEVQDRS